MGTGKLRIGGAWSGLLEVDLDDWTVAMLRQEVANRSHCAATHYINLICAGRVLKDGECTEKLSQLGVKNNSKILASMISIDQDANSIKDDLLAEEERDKRLSRLKAAATSLASRHADGSLPVEDFNLELENQSGEKVQLGSETDQWAIMMGLMLHANGKALIRREQYRDALEVLSMGEEAFSLCDPKLIEMVDNVPILQIDMVWCYFMLSDISWLSVAGVRLTKAREGIERAHGKESTRLRILQGGRYPELALHLRMELLEGVVAYHSGQLQKSKATLTSAQAKFLQLQVPDEALSLLMSMGYKEREANRALRMNNMNVGSAVDFLVEEKAKKAKEREENLRRQKEILEQKQYGMTPLRKAVDVQKLNELVSIGFEKYLAAEALRRNENDTQKALDDLTNPEANAALQNEVISRKRKRLNNATSAREKLISMGFETASVEATLGMFGGSEEQSLNHLLGQPNENAANTVADTLALGTDSLNAGVDGRSNVEGSGEGPSSRSVPLVRDVEMEDLLTEELHNADAYSDYDIQVTKEGEALAEYLALLNSAENAKKLLSSQ
ncbi:nedd8 ultimate buster 1 [Phtheirospermum japonicum]|uniref:Nedd8 ultimate buster 1 n=1 Tax=Phtheirospermum japonicum TaxID=374723 RepID=A0A830BZV5_9LAMI|nr:nedd8 ultimate buster 1 [Phtheirospermum japonicum]